MKISILLHIDYITNEARLQSPVSKKQSKQKKCDPTHSAPGHGEKMKDEWVGEYINRICR